jgi:hypothetical protein
MYYGLFECEADVRKEFGIGSFEGTILFAAYEYEDYSGSAEVIYVHKGKFWHVSGGHCSCYGLENQWEPEEMPYVALKHIAEKASYGMLSEMREQIMEALDGAMARVGVNESMSQDVIEFALRIGFD